MPPAATDPPSPSPPPTAPTATLPGPRAQRFTALYEKTLDATLKGISYDNFAACFPEIAERAPENLRAMHGNFVGRLGGFAKDEFQTIITERNVVENLNRLEDLIADARKRKSRSADGEQVPAAPHTLPPSSILTAHLSPHLTSQQSQLNAKLQTVQSQNAELSKTILDQRSEIEELVNKLEVVVKDLEEAGGLLAQQQVTEVGTLGRRAEEDLLV